MSTNWATLRTDLLRVLRLVDEHAADFTGVTEAGHEVVVEHRMGTDMDWVVLRSPICAQGEMDPAQVLERSGRMAFATLVLVRGIYWLRVALPCDSVELRDLAKLVGLLTEGARSLWPYWVAQPATLTGLYSHYCE